MSNSKTERRSRMDGETAMAFAVQEFESRHPRETWPEWLIPCTTLSYTTDELGRFVVSYTVAFKEPLKAYEQWEDVGDQKRIIRTDPETKEKLVIFRHPRRVETYFKVLVDPDTAKVTVLIERDLSDFVGEELNR